MRKTQYSTLVELLPRHFEHGALRGSDLFVFRDDAKDFSPEVQYGHFVAVDVRFTCKLYV